MFGENSPLSLKDPVLKKDSALFGSESVASMTAPVDRASQFDTAESALSSISDEKKRKDLLELLTTKRNRETAQQSGEMLAAAHPKFAPDYTATAASGGGDNLAILNRNLTGNEQNAGYDVEQSKMDSTEAKELEEMNARHARELEELRAKNRKDLKGDGGVIIDEEGNVISAPNKQDFTQEQQLRTQLSSRSKDFGIMKDAYSRIKGVSNGGAMSDISLIYQYMKMNDPGSTVREGEFATAQNAASAPDRIRNMYNKVAKGERLNTDQRAEIVNNSKNFYDSAARIQDVLNTEYSQIAKDYGLKPERVVGGFSTKLPNDKPAPKVSNAKIALAKEALNDPNAPEAAKAQARKILGQ
jgi:hypothetical protein